MSPLSLRCIKAAFACLALGIGLGASFALDRGLGAQLRPLHAELLLWGWATLLIYGMGWHMLPRFAGRPVRWPRAAEAQSWLAIGGVALAALGWLNGAGTALRLIGGALQGLAALLFAALIADLVRRRV